MRTRMPIGGQLFAGSGSDGHTFPQAALALGRSRRYRLPPSKSQNMTKQKTKKAVVKRMRLTKTGKVKFRHAFTSHLMVRRSSKRKRQLRQKGLCKGLIAVNMRELLGGS